VAAGEALDVAVFFALDQRLGGRRGVLLEELLERFEALLVVELVEAEGHAMSR
jgi:hypothetical protein